MVLIAIVGGLAIRFLKESLRQRIDLSKENLEERIEANYQTTEALMARVEELERAQMIYPCLVVGRKDPIPQLWKIWTELRRRFPNDPFTLRVTRKIVQRPGHPEDTRGEVDYSVEFEDEYPMGKSPTPTISFGQKRIPCDQWFKHALDFLKAQADASTQTPATTTTSPQPISSSQLWDGSADCGQLLAGTGA
jgi:hypothetical protein